MPLFTRELGIDLGTINTLVAEGNQILVNEPTVVAVVDEEMMVEWGKAAKEMYGKVPENIEVARPLQNGVIAYYEYTENLLKALKKRVSPMNFFRPKAMITVPYGITSVEKRAVYEAGLGGGFREVSLIWQPQAAALGVDLPIHTPSGNMILCMGGGTSQAAVMAMNGIVTAETSRVGGLKFDDAIIAYIRKKYGLIIGQPTAEQLKLKIGAAIPQEQQKSVEIQGQDQVNGLPRPANITTDEIVDALQEPLNDIVQTAKRVLEKTPPELLSDIIDRGIALCGGSAMLLGVDRFLTKSLGIPAYLVDNPLTCTAEGASKGLANYPILKRNLPSV